MYELHQYGHFGIAEKKVRKSLNKLFACITYHLSHMTLAISISSSLSIMFATFFYYCSLEFEVIRGRTINWGLLDSSMVNEAGLITLI